MNNYFELRNSSNEGFCIKIGVWTINPTPMTSISVYHTIEGVVHGFAPVLHISTFVKKTGRKLALSIEQYMSMALFKQTQGIETKKQTYEILEPSCSYKTFVVNLNRWAPLCALILVLIMKMNRKNQHTIKHIDSTNIPVCLFKNANAHKIMKGLASFGHSSKGTYFGLKLHIISDFERKLLTFRFTAANVDDREMVMPLSAELWGILIGDAGYISAKIAKEFHWEKQRVFLAKPRANMKKIMTTFEQWLYDTRAVIELNFRNLKMFHNLVTSLPRSVDGYLANYITSLLAYAIA